MSSQTDPLAGFYADEEEDNSNDPLAGFYAEEEKPDSKQSIPDSIAGPYQVEEKTPEELRAMTLPEKMEYMQEVNRLREFQQSKGFTKGALSGLTLGATEHVEALKPQEGELLGGVGEVVGSAIPITGVYKVFGHGLGKVAAKSPVFKKSLDYLAHLTGAALAGGTYEGAKHAIKEGELPSANQVMEHGFEWAAIEAALRGAGAVGAFGVGVIQAARKTKQPEWKVVNEVYNALKEQGVDVATDKRAGAKAMSILEDMGQAKPAKGEVRKVEPKKIEKANESIGELSKPILPEAQEEAININAMVENAEAQELQGKIDRVGRRTVDDAELGKEIQTGINDAKEAAKQQYKPFYDEVEEGVRNIATTPKETARIASDLLPVLEELRTKPAGYSNVINTLENVLKDAGYVIQRAESGVIESIIQEKEIWMDKLTELGRRLNEIIDYDVLDKTIKDRLRPVVKAVKRDIRSGLEAANPDLLTAFELAEESYAANAKKFNRESVRKIRGTQATDKIPKQFESATALDDMRAVLSPKQMQNVERDLLEKMNKMTEKKADEFLRQVRSGLSKESQEIADQIIRQKRPINKQSIQSRKDRLAETIDNELANSMNTGKRPEKTLELWQNPRGQKLVKQSLETHPQKKELLEYLQKQTLQDMAESIVTKEGAFDAKKLSEMMDNPAIRNNLRELGGQEAVTFFEGLQGKVNNLKNNTNKLITNKLGYGKEKKVTQFGEIKEAIDEVSKGERGKVLLKRMASKDFPLISKVNNALEHIGLQSKIAFNVFTLLKFGFVKAAGIPFAANVLKKLATSRKARDAFTKASKHHTDPILFIAAMENLGKELEE